ncbi:unnamed protein product, partial [Sphacelaria rigidula]
VYCSSIGCPGGIPIVDAGSTECDYGICTVKQCCDFYCWGFQCTIGYLSSETINEKCPPDEGCTPDLCCTVPVIPCSHHPCPNGWIPIPDAPNVPCTDGECTTEQCCESFCWSYPCPGPYIPDPETVNDKCPTTGCTLEECCAAFCWGHACPNGKIPNPETNGDKCPDSTCTGDDCPLSGCTDELCCI